MIWSSTQLPASNLVCDVLQAQGANGAKLRYTGMTDVLRKTVQADGFKGLYRVSFLSYQPLHPLVTAVSSVFLGGKVLLLCHSHAAYVLLTAVMWVSCCDIRIVLNRFCRHAWYSTELPDMSKGL